MMMTTTRTMSHANSQDGSGAAKSAVVPVVSVVGVVGVGVVGVVSSTNENSTRHPTDSQHYPELQGNVSLNQMEAQYAVRGFDFPPAILR